MIPPEWISQAHDRIAPHIRRTLTSNDAELNLYLKWENQQVTGSFKIRGALNKVLSLSAEELGAGLVTASAGNHGQGVAFAGSLTNSSVDVFVSKQAVPSKLEAMKLRGARLHLVDGGYDLAEKTAIQFARSHKRTWVSPYNDGQVIAGQGTIGKELAEDISINETAAIVVPVGGGGLLAGIGAALESIGQRAKIIGVQAESSAFMYSIFRYSSQEGVQDLPTLADGLAGFVEVNSVTIPMVKKYAADIILVSEDEIKTAIAYATSRYQQRIEGSAAVSLAAVLAGKVRPPAILVISGGNIEPEIHQEICLRYAN